MGSLLKLRLMPRGLLTPKKTKRSRAHQINTLTCVRRLNDAEAGNDQFAAQEAAVLQSEGASH